MNQGIKTVIYPVRNVSEAKTFFSKLLGVEPYMDEPYYVGFTIGDQDIGLDPNGHKQGLAGPLDYYHVDDIKKSLQELLDAGAQAHQDIKNVGRGKLTTLVKDSSGNIIGLIQMP